MLKFLSQLRHEQPIFQWRHQPWSSSANFFQAVFGWKTNIEMGRTGTHWSFFFLLWSLQLKFQFRGTSDWEKNASISKIWSVRQERIKPLRDWKDYFKAWAAFINPLKIQLRRRRLYWEKKIRECDSAWMVLWKNIRSTCCTCVLVWVVITGIVVIIFSIITQPQPVHYWEGIPQMKSQGINSHSSFSLFLVPYEG